MKNYLKLITFCFLNAFFIAKIYAQNYYQISTIAELKEMAKKYNLQDFVSETINNDLQFFSKAEAELYFKKEFEEREKRKQIAIFLEKTKYVRSSEDYLKLLNSLPLVLKIFIKSEGGEQKWADYTTNLVRKKQKIFRNKDGGLLLIRESSKADDNSLLGWQRIDNLPRQ